MPRAAVLRSMIVLVVSTLVLFVLQMGLNTAAIDNDFPFEMRVWMALPMVLPMAVPLAMLPIMMLARGTARVSAGGAAAVIAAAALVSYVTAGWIGPSLQGDFRAELYEEMYQRAVLNDQAGRVTYPATAIRQIRPTTREQRAAAHSRFRRDPRFMAATAARTRPQWGPATIMVAALSLAMGALGWALGGLGRTRVRDAVGWWCFTWLALLVLEGRFLYPGNLIAQYIGRQPDWMPLAVFATAALTVSVAARRTRA